MVLLDQSSLWWSHVSSRSAVCPTSRRQRFQSWQESHRFPRQIRPHRDPCHDAMDHMSSAGFAVGRPSIPVEFMAHHPPICPLQCALRCLVLYPVSAAGQSDCSSQNYQATVAFISILLHLLSVLLPIHHHLLRPALVPSGTWCLSIPIGHRFLGPQCPNVHIYDSRGILVSLIGLVRL